MIYEYNIIGKIPYKMEKGGRGSSYLVRIQDSEFTETETKWHESDQNYNHPDYISNRIHISILYCITNINNKTG